MKTLAVLLWLGTTGCSLDWTSHNHLRVVWFHKPPAEEMDVERTGDDVTFRRRQVPEGVYEGAERRGPCGPPEPPSDK